ncbi:hypothetical protein MPC4_140049 [Methylocella tundrae]|uniref:Uncharacterized protein n=1 Tax=Methylocella tundrae TaxID=227605 RepID=A0A8B6M4B8_METTU|nr:hypothetical protein MPC4_140049 [Methylocella tundrae]
MSARSWRRASKSRPYRGGVNCAKPWYDVGRQARTANCAPRRLETGPASDQPRKDMR